MAKSQKIHHINGCRAIVLLARFCDAFIRKGVIKSFGVLVAVLTVQLDTNYTTIGFILSMNAACMQLGCLLVNPLMKRFTVRPVAAIGGLGCSVCIMCTASTLSTEVFGFLFITAGLFCAASNLGTAITLREHFGEKFGMVNSLALTGISMGSTFLPLVTAKVYQRYGLRGSLLILGGLLLNELPIGAVLSPGEHSTSATLTREVSPEATDGSGITDSVVQDSGVVMRDEEFDFMSVNTKQSGSFQSEDATMNEHVHINTARRCCHNCLTIFKHHFDFRVFREEKHFSLFMVPYLILSSITNYSWVLFVSSYGISVGINPFASAFLAGAGAAGGIFSCLLQAALFNTRPQWSPHLLAVFSLSAALTLFIQTTHSSMSFLLICSFVIGGSLYGVSTVADAVVSLIVSPHNFQGALAITFALEGVGTLIGGPFSGFLFDMTSSFKIVFLVLGGIMTLTLMCAVILILSDRGITRPSDVRTIDGENL